MSSAVIELGARLRPHQVRLLEQIEAAIEIERRNAESNNLREDKDERDGTKNKPDPV